MTLKTLPHGRLQEWVAEEQGYFAATQAWTRRVFPVLPEPARYAEAVLS